MFKLEVNGASDDLVEFYGAVDAEYDAVFRINDYNYWVGEISDLEGNKVSIELRYGTQEKRDGWIIKTSEIPEKWKITKTDVSQYCEYSQGVTIETETQVDVKEIKG